MIGAFGRWPVRRRSHNSLLSVQYPFDLVQIVPDVVLVAYRE